jgi:hypothetical protein
MPHRRHIPKRIQDAVRVRANYLCEYCHTAEKWQYIPFTVDHILPITEGGANDLNNLALACFHCNRRKSNLITAIDPDTNEPVALFNPRQHSWSDHFCWSQDRLRITAKTPIGRATVATLDLNRERVLRLRAADLLVSRHPPEGDDVEDTHR